LDAKPPKVNELEQVIHTFTGHMWIFQTIITLIHEKRARKGDMETVLGLGMTGITNT
jgi:hypothetical protein